MTTPDHPPTLELAAPPPPAASAASATPAPFVVRVWSVFMLVMAIGMLGLGLYMKPSPKGLGTHHENFFLPPCGMYALTGIPCPTCGCTTAVTWFAHGHPIKSFLTQPFGALVALSACLAVLLGGFGLITGRWIGPKAFTIQWHWNSLIYLFVVYFVGAWVYKIIAVKIGFP